MDKTRFEPRSVEEMLETARRNAYNSALLSYETSRDVAMLTLCSGSDTCPFVGQQILWMEVTKSVEGVRSGGVS